MARGLPSAADLGEEPQHFEVEPDQSDQHAKGAIPFHIFWRAGRNGGLDEVEIEHQIESGEAHDKKTEADADYSVAVNVGNLNAKETQDQGSNVEHRDAARRGDDSHLEI